MAPFIPKRRRVERPHELNDRPAKFARTGSATGVAPLRGHQSRSSIKPATNGRHVDESSDSDEGEEAQSKLAYGSLLGALKVPSRHASAPLRQIQPSDKTNGHHRGHDRGQAQTGPMESDSEYNTAIVDEEPVVEVVQPNDVSEIEEHSDEGDSRDPFSVHFSEPPENELLKRLHSVKNSIWLTSKESTSSGRIVITLPKMSGDDGSEMGTMPMSARANLKQKLRQSGSEALSRHKQIAASVGPSIYGYRDLLFGGRTPSNAESLRSVVCLHALNHVLKTRDIVIKNNARLARDPDASLDLRDQGFTRPKVLILLETRSMCVKYMEAITTLFAPEQQENKKRFEDGFVSTEAKYSNDKPLDFRELFEGNDDNEFRLGIKFTRKTIKYYSQFYNSDIIIASPLGLRRALKAEDPKHTDSDFLSSIELFVVDQADAMLMQNFEHVEHIFEYLNLQPKEAHGCDFSRVRQWYLDGNARYLRQTIILSAFLTPELNSIHSKQMQNVAGKVKLTPTYNNGTIMDMGLSIRQTFNRYASRSPDSDPDDRFKYFVSTIIPLLNRQLPHRQVKPDGEVDQDPSSSLGALIFIPSYLDFVRIRNHFSTSPDTTNLSFGSISEYTEVSDARRARSHFLAGRQNVMLYTGRAHHFHRYRIRGVKRVILYGIPENPVFYPELVGGLLGQSIDDGKLDVVDASIRVLFSRYDGLVLERVVGSKRASKMLREVDDTFEFT